MMKPCRPVRGLLVLLALPLSGIAGACHAPAEDPSRIAVAGGSLTEILYQLGEEDRIVAVDSTSNFPEAARAFPSIGYVRALSAEGVLSLEPTLVLGEHDMGPPEILAQLESTGVEMVVVPEAFTAEGVVAKVECVMTLLAWPEEKKDEVREHLDAAIAQLAGAAATVGPLPKAVVLLGIRDGVPIAAGTNTSGDGLLTMAGATNVFAGIEGWKPISLEAMTESAPAFIIMPSRGLAAAGGIEGVVAHPAVKLTPAGQAKQVLEMDGMAMLGYGPRTLAAAVALTKALKRAP